MKLRELGDVLVADGPFVTVLVESESDVENSAAKYDLVWKDVVRRLIDEGVDGATVDAVAAAKGQHNEGNARLVVATTDDHQVRLAMSLRHPPRQPIVDVAPVPHLMALVDELSQRVPYILVRADRAGATVEASRDLGDKVAELEGDAESGWGPNARGVTAWKHNLRQNRLERSWIEGIAQDVVRTISTLAADVHPELVISVGEERELIAIEEHLPPDLKGLWRTVEGGADGDGSEGLVRQRVSDLLSRHTASRALSQLEEFAEERGQVKRACEGVGAVVEALQKAQVATLLVTTEPPAEGVLWFGPEAYQIGLTAEDLDAMGVPLPSSGPVVDVLLRAAIGTGADVQLVPHELEQAPHGGVGALLRFAQP